MKRSLALLAASSRSSSPVAAAARAAARPRRATARRRRAAASKIGLVTDIGGLNDRGFNHLAYLGPAARRARARRRRRVFQSKSHAGLHPEPVEVRAPGLRPGRSAWASPRPTRSTRRRRSFPKTQLRDRRRRPDDASRTSRRTSSGSCSRSRRSATSPATSPALEEKRRPGPDVIGSRRRPEAAAGRPLHRRLPGGREGGRSGHQDAERLLAGLRGPGEVQGDRAQPDRAGRRRRLPGRGRLRARRARRGEGEGRLGHRRRRRPVVPRPAHPHERRRSASTRPSSWRSRPSWTASSRAANIDLRPRRTTASRSARSARRCRRPTSRRSQRIRADIIAGKIKNIPTEVK